MSRFFHGDSSSESSSSDEEELYSEEEEEEEEQGDSDEQEDDSDDSSSEDDDGVPKTGANRFMKGEASDSEDSSDDERKLVKSAKDKRLDELEGTIKLIENGEKINDWASISAGMPHMRQGMVF